MASQSMLVLALDMEAVKLETDHVAQIQCRVAVAVAEFQVAVEALTYIQHFEFRVVAQALA